MSEGRDPDAVVIGAGFAGLYMLHKLRTLGYRAVLLEAAGGVGGTWYWNRYPGARCDVESVQYSYSFESDLEQEWVWTERYSAQPDILRYLEHVADRFDLRRDIRLNTRVVAADYDEARACWLVRTEHDDTLRARYVITAVGCLSRGRVPDIPGRDTFGGETFFTGEWPHEPVDFSGKRVGVIGTGSSGVQCVTAIAPEADHLYVFQRTPTFSVPAHNRDLTEQEVDEVKARYPEIRDQARRGPMCFALEFGSQSALEVGDAERSDGLERAWETGGMAFLACFTDLRTSEVANEMAAEFVRGKIRAIVEDPEVAARLLPSGYPIGAKRVTVNTGYFETFNRANVTLVDLREEPIEAITRGGIRTRSVEYGLDALVFATGFDAMTGSLLAIDIRGRDGLELRDEWSAGPRTFLGLGVAGFPNLFTITGPGSPSVLSNVACSIEQHVEWLAAYIAFLDQHGVIATEPAQAAQDSWVAHVNEVAERTLMMRAASWYLGANVPGKPRVFMPYVGGAQTYRAICDEVAAGGYEGYVHRHASVDPVAPQG